MSTWKIRFHKYNLPKLLKAIEMMLDPKRTVAGISAVNYWFKGYMPVHLIQEVGEALNYMYREELEAVRDTIKTKSDLEEEVNKVKCSICNEEITGAAKKVGDDFTHLLCTSSTKEKENTDMSKKKTKAAKKAAAKAVKKETKVTEKKAVKKTAGEKKEKLPTISSIVEKFKDKDFEAVDKEVRKIHPDSKFNKKHLAWYQAQFRDKNQNKK